MKEKINELCQLINVVTDKNEMEATEILLAMNKALTGEEYKHLKFLMLSNGCERFINCDRHVAYRINEKELRENQARLVIRFVRI